MRAGHRRAGHVGIHTIQFQNRRKNLTGITEIFVIIQITARRSNICRHPVIRKDRRRKIRTERSHTNHRRICRRITTGSCFITSRKNDNTAVERTTRTFRINKMGERIGFNTSFVQILFIRIDRTTHQPPTALQDRSPHTGCIIDRINIPAYRTLIPSGKNLNRHNLHPVVVSAAARDTADADTIVVHGRDRPRHMRSMTAILGIRPRYIPLVFGKIIAIDVIDISVTVVIHSLLTVQFRLIDPHIGCKVLMLIHYPLIHDGDDDRRIARTKFPCGFDIDIASLLNRTHQRFISRILIMPLLIQHRIVEFGSFSATRINLVPIRTPYIIIRYSRHFRKIPGNISVILNNLYIFDSGQFASCFVQRHLIVEPHPIPTVQPRSPSVGLMLLNHRDYPLNGYGTNFFQSRIKRLNTRTRRFGTRHSRLDSSDRLLRKFHK